MNKDTEAKRELALQLWPYLTEEALEDEAYWGYIQMWQSRPTPGAQPHDILSWYTKQLMLLTDEERRLKEERENRPVLVEQSMNYLPLPVNPDTGEINPYALPLESIWLLEAMLDQNLRDPKNRITKALAQGQEVALEPGRFEASTTYVRKKIGRRFSDQEQVEAFDKLVDWKIVSQYIWDEKKGSNGGWIPVKSEHGIHVISEWFKDEERRAGAPDSQGRNRRYIFRGEIHHLAWFIIRYNMASHRFHEIPKAVYRMSPGAQLLYRQGLPFVLKLNGWALTYPVACRVLGYPESPIDFQPGAIEKYIDELKRTVDWRRDKDEERKRHSGRGADRLWVLRASKKAIRGLIMSHEHQKKVQQARTRKQLSQNR